jgi:hypothetical protein
MTYADDQINALKADRDNLKQQNDVLTASLEAIVNYYGEGGSRVPKACAGLMANEARRALNEVAKISDPSTK